MWTIKGSDGAVSQRQCSSVPLLDCLRPVDPADKAFLGERIRATGSIDANKYLNQVVQNVKPYF